MSVWFWRCNWCLRETPSRHTETEAEADRDKHLRRKHPFVVAQSEHMKRISHYTFREVHS